MATLYEQLKMAQCQTDNHASDLYVKASQRSIAIVRAWEKANPELTGARYFTSQIDGELWFDIPFMYAPFWRDRGCTA